MRVIKDAYNEAKSKGLSPEQAADLISSKIMYYTEAVMDEVRSRTPDKYGASVIPYVFERGLEMVNNGFERGLEKVNKLLNPKSKEK